MVDTLRGRLAWLERYGAERVLVLRFDAELAARPAEWFAREVLFGALGAGVLVAGEDARFGHRGEGDLALLRRCAGEAGATVQLFDQVANGDAPISSSRIRQLVAAGDVRSAAALLGRPFCLHGKVVHGDARGGTIGFSTANLDAPDQVQPAAGVYASRLQIDGQLLDGVTNAGRRPTVGGQDWRVETHVPGWSGDLYDREVSLHLIAYIRPEVRFEGVQELKAQIGRDSAQAMQILASLPPGPLTSCT
jgi:riboflavin kinase/FMN adenylyltransferase